MVKKHNTLYKKVKVISLNSTQYDGFKRYKVRTFMYMHADCELLLSLLRNFLQMAAFFFSGIDLNGIFYYCDMIK